MDRRVPFLRWRIGRGVDTDRDDDDDGARDR
jgi:hypothetical protein